MLNSTDIENRLQKTIPWLIGTVVIIIIVLVILHFWTPSGQVIVQDKTDLKAVIDTMQSHDRQREQQMLLLQKGRVTDSIHLSDIQDQLDDTQDQLDKLNKHYAQQRTTLDHSTLDTRLQFLSGHLPQGSTGR